MWGVAFCAPTGTKPPLGREEAVAGHPSGAAAAASVLGSSFAAFSPGLGAGTQKCSESLGQTASWFSNRSQTVQL